MTRRQWAVFLGVSCGFSAAAFLLPGGLDAYIFFFRDWYPQAPTPAWLYLFTAPIGLLPWPFSWALWTAITVIGLGLTNLFITQKSRWWIALLSPALLYDFWLGQSEILGVFGLLIGVAVVRRKIPGLWMGLAWILLLTKPQTGLAAAVLFAFWLLYDRRWRDLLLSGIPALGIIGACFFFWPTWLVDWINFMLVFTSTQYKNASVGWVGLLALIPLLISGRGSRERQLRMFLAAGLLVSPYLRLYHCVVLQSTEDRPSIGLITWAIFLISLLLGREL